MYTWIGIVFIMLVVVIWNNLRMSKERRKRNQKNFRKGFKDRKKNNQATNK
jgi:hypothetical protein